MSQTSLVELLIGNGIGRNARLEKIAQLLDWWRLQTLVERSPRRHRRPPYPPLAMFKALLLQQWYGLSDPGLEEALLDRVSFRRFCGLSLEGATPDETTLCRFRNDLKASGLGEPLFAEVSRQFEAAGLTLRSGTLIDATLVEARCARQLRERQPKARRAARRMMGMPTGPGKVKAAGCSSATRCMSVSIWLRPDPQPSGDASQDL